MSKLESADFAKMWNVYRKDTSSGDRSTINRARSVEDLVLKSPALYRLLRKAGIDTEKVNIYQYARVVWFFPFAVQSDDCKNVGVMLKRVGGNRIRQMTVLNESATESLVIFRSILRVAKHKSQSKTLYIDWNVLGECLFFWGETVRKRIRMQFLCAGGDK